MSAPGVNTETRPTDRNQAGSTRRSRPGLVLGVVLLATFVINLDSTIVNVALPAISQQLHASTSGLQWVVDAYNLAFAALILTGGTIGDRYGRRATLIAGLAVFAVGTGAASFAGNTGNLIALRVVMGVAAAFIFPTTLSIISHTFPNRATRSKAIGAWGATAGAAVAIGPVVGGLLLAQFSWVSVFAAMVPVAVIALTGALLVIPRGRPASTHRLDVRGVTVAALALGSLVYTIIEAPDAGWGSARTIVGFLVAATGFVVLVIVERRAEHPMLDVRLFTDMRFTAASGAVTLAFFALFGFTFLIILYFQITRGYSPLSTGVRILPVAMSLALASVLGTGLAVRIGNKIVVAAGLFFLVLAFSWVALFQTATTPYPIIVAQMILLGTGLGLSTAPATESILTVVRPDQAGVGSAVNDATRLVGGTLGVAIIGSVFASLYKTRIEAATALPPAVRDAVAGSYPATPSVAAHLPRPAGALLSQTANTGFLDGLHAGCGICAAVALLGAALVLTFLPAHPDSAALPA